MTISVNPPGSANTYNQGDAMYRLAGNRFYVITDTTPVVGTSGAVHYVTPVSGTITSFKSVLNGAITTGDALLTLATNNSGSFVNVTDGAITIANSSSAAGDLDSATPTAANTVAAGDIIRVTDDGTAGGSSTAGITIVVQLDDIQQGS